MSLAEARSYGKAGYAAQSAIFLIAVASLLSGLAINPSLLSVYSLVTGLLALVFFIGSFGAMENLSKAFSDRMVVDAYLLAYAFGSAARGASISLGLPLPSSPALFPSFSGMDLSNGISLGYVEVATLVTTESVLLTIAFYRITQRTGNRLFALGGLVLAANSFVRLFLGSYLFEFAPLILLAGFSSLGNGSGTTQPSLKWTDIPKGLVTKSGSYSSIWFTDEAIYRVRPALASVTWVAFIGLEAIFLVGQSAFRHFDVNGNFSPQTTSQMIFQGFAIFILMSGLVIVSRYRYPRFAPEEATKRAIERIEWNQVTRIEAKRSGIITISLPDDKYVIRMNKRFLKPLDELAVKKLGRSIVMANPT